jgi:hypothetical protein
MTSNVRNPYLGEREMFGTITDLPCLFNYEEALAHYNSIKPIRGSDNLRPICRTTNGRRKKHMQIINYGTRIACRLYKTDVLEFYPDGELHVKTNGWASNSTHQFISEILGYSVGVYSKRGKTVVTLPSGEALIDDSNPVLRLKRGEVRWEFVDKPQLYAYYVKRGAMAERRKSVRAFAAYARAMVKVFDPEQYALAVPARITAEDAYYQMLDPDQWADLLESVVLPKCAERTTGWTATGWTHGFIASPHKLKQLIDDAIKYTFCDEVLEERPTDKVSTNGNEEYASGGGTYL